ncbi:MAG: DUF1385 domain-containing protein [Ktedonobacterales bacterium]
MKRYNYGGQAVVEGVMMRGRQSAAVAVRLASGNILLHEEQLNKNLYASNVSQWPFVRGLLLLWDMLILGTRMMMFAATASLAPAAGETQRPADASPTGGREVMDPPRPSPVSVGQATITEATPREVEGLGGAGMAVTLTISLAFAIGLFFLLPLGIVGAAHRWLGGGWLSLTAEGVIRLALLIGYLALIGRFASIQRVFEYHGAEHKAINCYEAGLPLDVDHVRQASRVHTRCGTGFLLIVVVVSIVVFALLGSPPLPVRILSRIVLVPVIASIAYELMRLGAANYRYRVVYWLMAPSLALQGLTTREPDAAQMECAIVALERVLRKDGVTALERVA